MLADHGLPVRVPAASVVVSDVLAGRDQEITNAGCHVGRHLAEPVGGNGLGTGGDPRAAPLGVTPAFDERVARVIRQSRLEVKLEAPRVAGDKPHPVEQCRFGVDEHVRVVRHIDDTVIRREQEPVRRGQ